MGGARFHCIKDLVFHVSSVEDSWMREEILRKQPLCEMIPAFS
jgi:hypothetical protein